MDKYYYKKAVKEDILEWLKEEHEGYITDERSKEIYEKLWITDSVTGNASGSYTFNTWEAEENLCHNLDLIQDVISEFGPAPKGKEYDAEYWDVSIRCYLLGEMLEEARKEWNAEHAEEEDEAEEEAAK